MHFPGAYSFLHSRVLVSRVTRLIDPKRGVEAYFPCYDGALLLLECLAGGVSGPAPTS
jgi:hypothetical protein